MKRRKFIDILLGSGILATTASIVYPILRFVIPPDTVESAPRIQLRIFGRPTFLPQLIRGRYRNWQVARKRRRKASSVPYQRRKAASHERTQRIRGSQCVHSAVGNA